MNTQNSYKKYYKAGYIKRNGLCKMENILTNVLKNDRLDEYPLFKKFCVLKEKGLRKDSFNSSKLLFGLSITGKVRQMKHLSIYYIIIVYKSL